jgi:hypothetical protein
MLYEYIMIELQLHRATYTWIIGSQTNVILIPEQFIAVTSNLE